MTNVLPLTDADRAELIAFLDGELPSEAASVFEAKLNRDPRFQAEAETLRRAWDLLDYLPRVQPSSDFTSRTLEQIAAVPRASAAAAGPRRGHTWAWGFGWVAAVLLAAAGGYDWMAFVLHRNVPREVEPIDLDQHLIRDLRVIENKHLYDQVDSLDFLRALDTPELFGDER
jgi:anti-sigma factor RsiW